MNINLHGDISLIPTKAMKPPKTAKLDKIHTLQSSDTTNNRHEVVGENIFYWKNGEQEFVHSDKNYKIRHVGGDCEHGEQVVEAGTREVKHELEYNPWVKELRTVID